MTTQEGEPSSERVFQINEVVRVKGGSPDGEGEIEDGWKVFNFDPVERVYVVKKEISGLDVSPSKLQPLPKTKRVSASDLASWNK